MFWPVSIEADYRRRSRAPLITEKTCGKGAQSCFGSVDAAVEAAVLSMTDIIQAWTLLTIAPASFWLTQAAGCPASPRNSYWSRSLWA
jgi:hypothetical protein